MQEASKNNYFFLNTEGRWPGFQWSGLELREDGALRLSGVPLLAAALPDAVKTAPAPEGAAGLASDRTGTLYFTDPDGNRVSRILGCDGSLAAAPCMGGTNTQPTNFHAPRGVLIPPARSSLFVVDTGNHRIQVFDLDTFQLVEIWGQADPGTTPHPGSLPGEFDNPWTLAGDSLGNVYVVDYGNRRVQKFNRFGDVVPAFWNNASAAGLLHQPADIAVREQNASIWIYILDASLSKIFIFDGNGKPACDSAGASRWIQDPRLAQAMGMAIAGDALYVGDNSSRRVQRFQLGEYIEYVGEAIGYDGPVAALSLDGRGGLWVHPGGGLTPVKLQSQGGYRTAGCIWLTKQTALEVSDRQVVWHRLQALADRLAPNSHLDIYAYTADLLSEAPDPPDPAGDNPFADKKWQSIPDAANLDVTDLYIGRHRARYLWVAALLSGDGTATPILRQLRVEFDHPTYEQHLPAIYRNQADCGEFLGRLLSLFESLFGEVENEIRSLPRLFDPKAAPKRFLAWLAGCLGLNLDEGWDEDLQRRIIAEIFRLSGRRGTAAGLRESLRLFAGVNAIIEEPILNAAWWSLPSRAGSCCAACAANSPPSNQPWQEAQNSILGATTMLAPAQPQGAVVGTSAVLDQSHLIADQDFGSPLFTDVAFQFCVQVYRSQVMRRDAFPRIRAVLDREKPAHTAYHLCVVDPRFRVGFQSRVGIDTVVGGPPRSLALGTEQALGQAALAGAAPSFLGIESRLGLTTRLG